MGIVHKGEGMDSTVKKLVEALQSGDQSARAKAAIKLYEHSCDEAVGALSEALTDESEEVRGNAAESLRVIAVRGECRIPVEPLLTALKKEPDWWPLKECLRELGYDSQVEEILSQAHTAGPKYDVPCMGFGCPHCGVEITRAPSWPANGYIVPFYAQTDLYQSGAYHIELICRGCGKTVYVVWDNDPQ